MSPRSPIRPIRNWLLASGIVAAALVLGAPAAPDNEIVRFELFIMIERPMDPNPPPREMIQLWLHHCF